MSQKIEVLSLFTGAGGLDIGFSQLEEFEIKGHLDFDDIAIETLEANREQTEYIEDDAEIFHEDIREFEVPEHLKDVDLIIGGPPCQPFSAAGRRTGGIEGTDNEEGQLFKAYVDILKEVKPTAFLFENVSGVTSDEEDWKQIVETFQDAGYKIKHRTLDAADYGVPQHRARTFIVGVREDSSKEFKFPRPTHGPDSHLNREQVSCGEALEEIEPENPDSSKYELTTKHAHLLDDIPAGLNYSFYTEKLGHPQPKFGWRSRFSDFLYKADPEKPVRTIKAQPGAASGPFHWDNRKFTEKELKRLQTIPQDYILKGSYSQVMKQVGNSVPPELSLTLGKAISKSIFELDKYPEIELIDEQFEINFRSRKRTSSDEYKRKARERLKELGLFEPDTVRESNQNGLKAYTEETEEDEENGKQEIKNYFREYDSYFEFTEKEVDEKVEITNEGRFGISSYIQDNTLKIGIEDGSDTEGIIRIKVNKEGGIWHDFDKIQVKAKSVSQDDIFYIWHIIGDEVTDRTGYEKFIDAMGYYTTRGENYSCNLKFENIETTPEIRLLKFFSNKDNCNEEFRLDDIQEKVDLTNKEILEAVRQLRKWRFDIRTHDTHPTMSENKILCAYPFPDLNGKSHFEEDAELTTLREIIEDRN